MEAFGRLNEYSYPSPISLLLFSSCYEQLPSAIIHHSATSNMEVCLGRAEADLDLDHDRHRQLQPQQLQQQQQQQHEQQQQEEQRKIRQLKRQSLPARPHAAARHKKRLTLNFPINIPPGGLGTDTAPASAVEPSPIQTPMTPFSQTTSTTSPALGAPLPLDTQQQADESTNLLTAIASQERKVLELREELQRAETELSTLKKKWTLSEKTKKRTEVSHHAEPLISLRSPVESVCGEERESLLQQHRKETAAADIVQSQQRTRELERRRSMRIAPSPGTTISANGRRVFQGSHARTLSLLSASTDSGFSSGKISLSGKSTENEFVGRMPRSATLPSSTERGANGAFAPTEEMITEWRTNMPPASRASLVHTGKQMASDLREGLWTFLEDIRQATVGEEGINATEVRGMSPAAMSRKRDSISTSTSRSSRDRLSVHGGGTLSRTASSSSRSRGAGAERISGKDTKSTDIDSSFWSEFGIDTPGQKSPNARGASNPRPNGQHNNLEVYDDDWDAWEASSQQPNKTHTPSSSRSTLESKHGQSPRSQASSPRTSAR